MKKTLGILSLAVLLLNSLVQSVTYAENINSDEIEGIMLNILGNTMNEFMLDENSLPTEEIKTAEFINGEEFNIRIKTLAGNENVGENTYFEDYLVKKMKKYTGNDIPNSKIIISKDESEYPIYARYDSSEETVYYYTEANKIYFNEDSSKMFRCFKALNEINFHEFDLSRVTNLEAFFYGFGKKDIDLSFMDLNNVTNTNYMFQSNNQVENINFEGIQMKSLINIGSNSMFNAIPSLISVNLSGSNFENLESTSQMFYSCNKLEEINISYANFSKAETANMMFQNEHIENLNGNHVNLGRITSLDIYGKNIDFSYAILSGITEKPYIWTDVETINFEGTDLRNLESMENLLDSRNKLKSINLSGTKLDSLTNMSNMFKSNYSIQKVDFTHTDLSNVTTMNEMFSSAYGIKYVNFSGSNLKNLQNTKQMFNAAKNLTGVNFHGAILTGLTNVEEMFNSSYNHDRLLNIDFGEAKLGTTLNSMFKYSKINNINFSGADFSNVVDAGKLFYYIPTLLKIDFTNIKGANKITNMESMFYYDTILTGIDLSNFDLSKVKNMYGMFQSCNNLKNINFGDSKIKPEGSLYSMFEDNYYLTGIDLSNFDTSEVTNMSYMFASNKNLKELDLSNFDTRKVKSMDGMFNSTEILNRIYVGENFKTNNVTTSGYMFNKSYNIKGGNGTEYDSNHTDGLYAVIDDENNSGYFTNILDKEYNIKYIIEPEYTIGGTSNTGTYTPRNGTELKRASKPGYELEYWYESGYNIPFEINESTRGDKTLYPKWKAIEEKAQETTSESVVYTNETTVTIGDNIQEETINNSSLINLVSKEVETEEVKAEEEKITIQESEIQVTSDKTVEYQGGLEVYLEKTENVGTEVITERIEGTAKFSTPVAVKIPIYSNAETVKVQVKHEGEEFGYKGLTRNPINSCLNGEAINDKYNGEKISVKDVNGEKYALIYTCSASTFVAYTENTKPTNNTTSVSSPAAGGGRIITSTKNENNISEQEHNSAETVKAEVEETTTKTTDTQAIKEQVNKIKGRSLTRGEVAVMTNILLDVYPKLTDNRELNEVSEACENYADEQNFTKDEKKAITRLCKLSIMGIHADDNKPLDEFMVNEITKNDEFSKVINRSLESYTEKDFSVVKDALKKLEGDEENVVFGTVYDVFMSIKNILN